MPLAPQPVAQTDAVTAVVAVAELNVLDLEPKINFRKQLSLKLEAKTI